MATHKLKCWPAEFSSVKVGRMKVQMRKMDRDFRIGDTLELTEYSHTEDRYSGRTVAVTVTHILTGGQQGIIEGYAALSIEPIDGTVS